MCAENTAVVSPPHDPNLASGEITPELSADINLFGNRKDKKKGPHTRIELRDERHEEPIIRVEPIQPVILKATNKEGEEVTDDLTAGLNSAFDYLSRTKGLEIGSARCDILQEYADRMVAGNPEWEGKVQVVIMNKGIDPDGFAYPDGSIFISQSLINMCDSLDELIAVLGHEVKHIVNGTAKAAYKAETLRGGRLGVKWLHEMTSDFGASELLEKVGLKSTASVEMLSKFAEHFGNQRGTEHQAPILRAIEQLGVHAVKDFENSHIDYTPMPPELKRPAQMTNFEAIIDAITKDDIDAVRDYLLKLHPRDFGTFFEVIDRGHYYQFGQGTPDKKTQETVTKMMGTEIVTQLKALNLSDQQIKLFFLATTGSYSELSPQFHNLDEITSVVEDANSMYVDKVMSNLNEKIFDSDQNQDLLFELLGRVEVRLLNGNHDEALEYADIDSLAQLVETVTRVLKPGLLPMNDHRFADESGRDIADLNRESKLYRELQHIIFNYIEEFYLTNADDGELDQAQIEDIFESVKEVGFEPIKYYSDPFAEKYADSQNLLIVKDAFKHVFGYDLVIKSNQDDQLLSPEEFAVAIKTQDPFEMQMSFKRFAYKHELSAATSREYTEIAISELDSRDYWQKAVQQALTEKIGWTAVSNWRDTGDPKISKYSARFDKNNPPAPLSFEEVITMYQLNEAEIVADARRREAFNRLEDKVLIVSDMLSNFEPQLFDTLNSVLAHSGIDITTLTQAELLTICYPLFQLTSFDGVRSFGEKITDFESFYQLPLVKELVAKTEKKSFATLADLITDLKAAKHTYNDHPIRANFSVYEDDLYSVILGQPYRDEIARLTQPENISPQDYPVLVDLLNDFFPYNVQVKELLKKLRIDYLNNQAVSVQDKIDFFFTQYESLGVEGAVIVAEQITDLAVYRQFRERLGTLGFEYVSGEKGIDTLATTDIASSMLTSRSDTLIKSASGDPQVAKEVSTDLATMWVETYLVGTKRRLNQIQYDANTGKFILTERGRNAFASLSDTISYFKNLSESQKLIIVLKAMADEKGLLVTVDGRRLLEKMLVEGLDLKDDFLTSTLVTAVRQGDPKIVGLPASKMLVPFLFRALQLEAIDYKKIGNREIKTDDEKTGKEKQIKIKQTNYVDDLPRIFSSDTRSLRHFGAQYQRQPHSELAQRAQASGESYFQTLAQLNQQFESAEPDTDQSEKVALAPAVEAMIKAGETSPIFVRGMQMAVQLIDFPPEVQQRLAQTQDSMHGMEKLRFWDNLLAKSYLDPELARFLDEDLLTLDGYLGGGSLFTTYGATVKGENGEPKKVVIKMLNPNAEEFIRLSYEFSSGVLADVVQQKKGKTRENARLAGSLIDLSYSWCIADINDPNYAVHDDAFRQTIETFNQQKGRRLVEAPQRGPTTKKVKIEDQYEGTTLNKMLAKADIADQRKKETVQNLLDFFDHQFAFSPMTNEAGQEVYIFHSDPHAGNYMVNPDSESSALGAIDRSMYLALERRDVDIFEELKKGNGTLFINQFIMRCLEINNVTGREATQIRFSILNQLGGETLRQKLGRRKDMSAYLQIVLQSFANFGEKFSVDQQPTTEALGAMSDSDQLIIGYFQLHPEADALKAFNDLGDKLKLGSTGDQPPTPKEFKDRLLYLKEQRVLQRKAVDVPIEYRLMIRNIIAMQNLRQRWIR